MSNKCELKKSLVAEENGTCPRVVNEKVNVCAKVTITPDVKVDEINYFCLGNPTFGSCPIEPPTLTPPASECCFTVCQKICVEVPLTFSANAQAVPNGIECGEPGVGDCNGETGCTFTIGYYKNKTEITNALITGAGGSIVLGVLGQGASFVVTTANANAVLDGNTPSPPAPSSQPFANQYQILYAQLLAANLNVLGGATCDYVTDAIAAANAFLASSISGVGKDGAPEVQKPLAIFNEGNAPGCPLHCPD